MRLKYYVWFLILGWQTTLLQAQQEGPPPIRIGVGMMGITYRGDLTVDEGSFQRFSPGGHLQVQFAAKKPIRPSLLAGYGGFREQIDVFPGNIPAGVEPNTFVETNFFFADFRLNYFLLSKKRFSPFVAAGVGMFSFSPEDQDGNFLGENIFTRLEGETYNTTILSIPLSIGFQYEVNQVIALSLGYTHRLTPSDYLDNIGSLGTKEGNDVVQHFQVGVHFSLVPGDQIKRPPPPQDPDRPLDIVAFPPEENRQVVFQVPERLTADIPPNRSASNRIEQLIETDLARVQRENRSLIEQGDSYLTDWQRQEQEAIAAEQFIYYAVKPTDQLGDIARRFRTTPQMIRQLNQLPAEGLGEQVYLRIPDVNQHEDTLAINSPIQSTDSLANDPDWLALEEEALLEERFRFIFVRKEQSLAELAQRYHVRLETILKLNYLQEARLQADTYLRIPDLGAY